MTAIDEPRLERDLGYRFGYVAGFIGFGPDDTAAVHAAAPLLAPLVPGLVDAVYAKLQAQDATWRHFLPRQHGYAGEVPTTLAGLTMDHPQIAFRKDHLARYLVNLVTKPYDGKMHTDKAGSKDINVPLVQMNALMGFVSDALANTILGLNLPREAEVKTLRAFNKLLWLQNDLITRHYQRPAAV